MEDKQPPKMLGESSHVEQLQGITTVLILTFVMVLPWPLEIQIIYV